MTPNRQIVRLELGGKAIEALGWLVLFILASIVIIPGAWVLAAIGRWFCRNLRASDGRTATFTGRGGEIVGWWILAALCGAISHEAGGIYLFRIRVVGLGLGIPGDIIQWLLGALAWWMILRWFVANVQFDSGERFRFEGGYWMLLVWNLWVALLFVTIVGWAWGMAAMYRWMAENTRSGKSVLGFYGRGHEILWRTLVTLLLCILIIPIPWACLWYTQWLVASTAIESPAAV
jgi:uncharacterized protein DUF898